MIESILNSLSRQVRALAVLADLLTEEFSLLSKRDAISVSSLEFSIQELLRQLAVERDSLHRHCAGLDRSAKRLADVLPWFDSESRSRAEALLLALDRAEKRCSGLSSRNYRMALGLYDVAKGCLGHLQSKLVPKQVVYGSHGRVEPATPAPGRINGRF